MTDESRTLWQEVLTPLLAVFREHVTADQLDKLRAEAKREPETPDAIRHVIDTLYRLRLEVERV